jgi:hypothetical protein
MATCAECGHRSRVSELPKIGLGAWGCPKCEHRIRFLGHARDDGRGSISSICAASAGSTERSPRTRMTSSVMPQSQPSWLKLRPQVCSSSARDP